MTRSLTPRQARCVGWAAIAVVLLLQAFNSFGCYQQDFATFAKSTAFFLGIPLLPAFIALATRNPLRAVGACALFAPWLLLAYYTDCVKPYEGGGASMVYVAVLLWGTPSAWVGFLFTPFVMRRLGIEVVQR